MSIETPVLPGIEWPEPVLTADLIIKDYLTASLDSYGKQHEAFDAMCKVPETDTKAKEQARAEWRLHLYIATWQGSVADLLIQIQEAFPSAADQIARDFHERGEEGNGEWIWDWATQRGLDPEKIQNDARAKWKEQHGG